MYYNTLESKSGLGVVDFCKTEFELPACARLGFESFHSSRFISMQWISVRLSLWSYKSDPESYSKSCTTTQKIQIFLFCSTKRLWTCYVSAFLQRHYEYVSLHVYINIAHEVVTIFFWYLSFCTLFLCFYHTDTLHIYTHAYMKTHTHAHTKTHTHAYVYHLHTRGGVSKIKHRGGAWLEGVESPSFQLWGVLQSFAVSCNVLQCLVRQHLHDSNL